MAKDIFVPTMDELYEMQDLNGNVHKYLLTKVVETLCMRGYKYPNAGILKSVYKYLCENEYISTAVCKMYPEEMKYSEFAQNNLNLCLYLLKHKENKEIYRLDNLVLFKEGAGVLSNHKVVKSTIDILSELLPENPKYRFDYRYGNDLLEEIFGRKILERLYIGSTFENVQFQLGKIEPTYGLLYNNYESEFLKETLLKEFIDEYARTYGIDSFSVVEGEEKFLETSEAKKLIKCIKQYNI